ncbi:MAG: Bug family tripartite tricarboxylate transporter substrate binding protein, partial [Candidatus Binatia bacterium]
MKLTALIRWRLGIVGVAMVLVSALWAVRVRAQAEPFYKGKQIRIITGATAGGFYDRWGRLLARAMPKYIPGQPDIIVQNMPGAGSLVALNYVNGVAKPDGLTTVMPNSNVYLEQLSGHKEVRFDLRKFSI